MSLMSIFGNGLSGLQAAQQGLRVVSQNVANVNTPGYARTEVNLNARTLGNQGGGVEVTSITRAADRFLTAAALTATGSQGFAAIRADLLDRAQSLFGDPQSDASLFSDLDRVFTRFTELGADPSSSLRRSSVLQSVQDLLANLTRTGASLDQLTQEADARLTEQAGQASSLMSRIADLNEQIQRTRASGGDATSAENAQSQLIDELAGFIDIRTTPRELGGVDVRTTSGMLLVGDAASSLTYTAPANGVSGGVMLVDRNGVQHALAGHIQGGSIGGLLEGRDDLTKLSLALGQLAGASADALNAAHNESTAIPPPTSLAGRNTGLLGTDALNFTGNATIGIVDSSGVLQHRVEIDFDNRTIDVDGGGPTSYGAANVTVAQFVAGLNTALGSVGGGATFTAGRLSINGGADGLSIQQDATDPSARGGRGFSQFFGLNDLITRDTPSFFETGLSAGGTHGLTAGGALSFRVLDSSGRVVSTRSVGVTGTTWTNQITALNSATNGLGGYGSFAMDSQGRLNATMAAGYTIEITGDTTVRGATGLSMSDMFGLDQSARAGRAQDMALSTVIAANPGRLALGRPDLSQPLNATVLESGDNRGALALAAARDVSRTFPAAGVLAGQTATLATYASRLGGEAGRQAEDAARAQTSAEAVVSAAVERRSSKEGVSLDDELVRMTQFQQSYAASSRMIQAATEMFDILLSLK